MELSSALKRHLQAGFLRFKRHFKAEKPSSCAQPTFLISKWRFVVKNVLLMSKKHFSV